MRGTRLILGLAALLLLVTTACEGSKVSLQSTNPVVAQTSASVPQPSALASPSDAPTVTPTPSSSPSAAPTSPATACLSVWEICTTSTVTGNFDGRSGQEVFTASPIWRGDSIVDWNLDVALPAGGHVSAHLNNLTAAQGSCPALQRDRVGYAVVRGAANFTGAARELAVVQISNGASTVFGILVGIQNRRPQLVTVANGAERCQRIFPFGGSVTHGNGLACGRSNAAPVLWVRQVNSHPPDYDHFDWYQATYAWQGLQLYLLSLDHAVITITDPRFGPAYIVNCGHINLI